MDEILVPRWLLESLLENTEALLERVKIEGDLTGFYLADMLLNEIEQAKVLLNEESPN